MKRILLVVAALVVVTVAGFAVWAYVIAPNQVTRTLVTLARNSAGLEVRAAEIPGFRIAYLEGGRGEPLVLLHGFGADKDYWTRISAYLTPHFRIIAPDLPGFGDSDKPSERRYRTQDQVEYVRAFVQKLGISSFSLGGNSMGGRIAAEYAAAYPNEVKSLWLLAPAGVASAQPSEMGQRLARGEDIPLLARNREEFDRLFAFAMTAPPYVPGFIKQVLTRRTAANYELHERIFQEIGAEWKSRPLERLVAGLRTPTRIVWGAEDRVLHVSGAAILRDAMPNASVLTIPLIGHLPMLEAPPIVAGDYLAFRNSLR